MQRWFLSIACMAVMLSGMQCSPDSPNLNVDEKTGMDVTDLPVPTSHEIIEIETPSLRTSTPDGNSGIEGITRSFTVSGVPGGETTGGPASLEFAIAPVESGEPVYERAIFVTSNESGVFRVQLSPGLYWLGPKGKALDPMGYSAGAVAFSEMTVEVDAGGFSFVELSLTGYAP